MPGTKTIAAILGVALAIAFLGLGALHVIPIAGAVPEEWLDLRRLLRQPHGSSLRPCRA